MKLTETVLQMSVALPASLASSLLQLWQQHLPTAKACLQQRRLLLSLWQQQARQLCQQQQLGGASAELQIWQQQQQCWLLLSWQPECCDLSPFWQQLATLSRSFTTTQTTDSPQMEPQLVSDDSQCVPVVVTLTQAALWHQLQHSILQPVWLQHNLQNADAGALPVAQPRLALQQQTLTPAAPPALCSDEPVPLLAMRLELPAQLSSACIRIAAVAQGLCLLELAAEKQETEQLATEQQSTTRLLAGSLCHRVQQQALLAGLNMAATQESPVQADAEALEDTAPCAVARLWHRLQQRQFVLEWGQQQLSAADLAALVVAWQPMLLSLTPGAVVALDLARGPEQLAACLACLFSGCAFVPLDRQLPPLRLQQMLTQLQPALVLTDRQCEATAAFVQAILPKADAMPVPTAIPAPVATPELRRISSAHSAYLIFTSGSTGTPKGVVLSRLALSTFLAGAAEATGLREGQRVLAHTSVGFDISLLELLLPLYCGARLRLLGEGQNRQLPAEPALWQDIDLLQGTPTLLRAMLAAGWQGHKGLTLLAGGEALDCTLVRQLTKRCARLLHCYGPTEATIWSMMATITDHAASEAPLLGPSLTGYQHRVVCSDGQTARPGMVGELLIAGSALADGYWQQPDLTASRFINAADGRRWYHSGDLVRQLHGDLYQYLGRLDQQVKLRGHRIELGEIDAMLRRQAAVIDCAVVLLPDPDRLVAALTGNPTQSAAIKDALQQQLPAYMLPQLVWFGQLPVNASGKTDMQGVRTLLIKAGSVGGKHNSEQPEQA